MARRRLAWLVLALGPATALGGNEEAIPLGDDAALTGNTVAAMVSDGSSLFYNPAGLAGATRDQIDVGATATMLRVYSLPDLLKTDDGAAGDGSFTEFVSVPSAVSYLRTIGPSLRLGFGLFVPSSMSWTIDVPLVIGSDTFHLSTTTRQAIYYGVVGLGWQATPELRLGASISGIYQSTLGTAVAWAGYDRGAAGKQFYSLAQIFSVTALGAAVAVGAQWEPIPGLHVGLSLRSPTLLFAAAISGSSVEGSATTGPPSVDFSATDLGSLTLGVHQALPLRARLGIAWAWGTSWVSIEGDIQPALDEEAIGARRVTTWNLRAGGILELAPQTWLGVGAFTDRSGDPTPESLINSHIDFYGVTVGVRLDHPHDLAASERARTVVFSTTLALRYAYGAGDVGGVVFERMPVSSVPAANSVVDTHVHELGVHLGSTVYF
jgi:hypothetical protein